MIIIESIIKSNPLGRWYIELIDTTKEENPENRVICFDINEYSQKVETMGAEHKGEVEIVWSSDENVTPDQINEVRMQIMAYEAEREKEAATTQE
jgi:hypothetical protein